MASRKYMVIDEEDLTQQIVSENNPEDNHELRLARRIIEETSANLFLTGKAGTGKTTFLRTLSENSMKRMVVLAPTGVAAINAGGMTIHSFFQLPFSPYVPGTGFIGSTNKLHKFNRDKIKLIKSLDLIVIDEVSMVRPDILDAIDDVLRRVRHSDNPFGGVQLLLIGDLRQLAPVVKDEEWCLLADNYTSPYFFESQALRKAGLITLELKKIYRQSDARFISILNSIRDNRCTQEIFKAINSRHIPGFHPDEKEGYIRLTTHNSSASSINNRNIALLRGKEHIYRAKISGNFPAQSFPAEESLLIKKGAQVMFVKNDPNPAKEYYNGLIGTVTDLDDNSVTVAPHNNEPPVKVKAITWQNIKYEINEETKEIKEIVDGEFAQIPLRHAWAITIHKSQGLTFDRCIIDAAHSFAPGQTYVALSRCKSLEGIVLENPIPQSAVMTDHNVTGFLNTVLANEVTEEYVTSLSRHADISALANLFDFTPLRNETEIFLRLCHEYLYTQFPSLINSLTLEHAKALPEMISVAAKFIPCFSEALKKGNEEVAAIRKRVMGGCVYFNEKISRLHDLVMAIPLTHIDNKTNQKRISTAFSNLMETLELKRHLLYHFSSNEFTIKSFTDCKTDFYIRNTQGVSSAVKAKKTKSSPSSLPEEIRHPEIYNALKEWRNERADNDDVPAYCIVSNKVILDISNQMPDSLHELKKIKGMGSKKIQSFGDVILEILESFR